MLLKLAILLLLFPRNNLLWLLSSKPIVLLLLVVVILLLLCSVAILLHQKIQIHKNHTVLITCKLQSLYISFWRKMKKQPLKQAGHRRIIPKFRRYITIFPGKPIQIIQCFCIRRPEIDIIPPCKYLLPDAECNAHQ